MALNTRIVDGEVFIELLDGMKPSFGDEVAGVIGQFLDQGHRRFVLDLSRVSVLDSAGLGGVARAIELVRGRGGAFRCTGSNPRLDRELRLTELARSFEVGGHRSLNRFNLRAREFSTKAAIAVGGILLVVVAVILWTWSH